jgi:hypothetical protein
MKEIDPFAPDYILDEIKMLSQFSLLSDEGKRILGMIMQSEAKRACLLARAVDYGIDTQKFLADARTYS